jgi:hypothetical protein
LPPLASSQHHHRPTPNDDEGDRDALTLYPILATFSTQVAHPVIGAVRLRRGKAADVRGAASFVAEALAIAKDTGGRGIRLVRADSKFYTADVVAACRTAGARFSLTTGMNPSIAAAIGRIDKDTWIPIRYPDAFVDTGEMISDAEIAEIAYTAFTGRKKPEQVTARLIARRVHRLNDDVAQGQGELFTTWRYHPLFTDSPFPMPAAELDHRRHAVAEQAIANGKSGPPAICPWGTSRPTRPGSRCGRCPTISCGPPEPWPRASTPRPPPPPCAPTWSTSPHGRPAPPAPS